jgi:PAS domain S-box-containing protein
MAGSADLNASRRAGIRAMHSTPLVSRSGRLLGMISTHWQEPHHPAEHEIRAFDVLARQAADLIERTQVETALRESEQQLRWLASIVVSTHDAIISQDLSGIITTWNNAAELLFGYTSEEVIGRPITILIPPDRHSEELSILERISRGELIDNYETVRRRRDGSSVNVSLTISPVMNAEGRIVGASKIARDITARKRAEAREKMLTAELDHRVKNILAQVAAITKSTRQGSRSVDEFHRSLYGRIQSLAGAHMLLAQSDWQGVGVDALVRSQLAPYADDTNITIKGTDVILAVAETQVLTRVLHELATNAAKYGALSIPGGRVSASWDFKPNGQAATLILAWLETGGPPVASKIKSRYGTDLIHNLIPHELGGKVDLVFAPEGVSCTIQIPVESTKQ